MKLKKIIAILACVIICFGCLSACNEQGNTDKVDTNVLFALEDQSLTVNVKTAGTKAHLYVNGEKRGSTFKVKENKVTLPAFPFNSVAGSVVDVKLDFIDETEKVVNSQEIKVDVVDRAIDSVAEFNYWYSGYETHYNLSEYVILTSDIELNGGTIDNWRMAQWLQFMYNGTFDGRGHVIYNFASKHGFIPNVGKDGVIKNLAMVNIKTEGTWGFLGKWLCGTVENCYFEGSQTNTNRSNYYTGFYGRYFDDQHDNGYVKSVSNVVIDVKRPTGSNENDAFIDISYLGGMPDGVPFTNVYMVNNAYSTVFAGRSWDGLDISMYSKKSDFVTAVKSLPKGFSVDYWEIGKNGLVMKNVKK